MKKILIIEDDPSIVELIDIHLKDIHCNSTKSYSGSEGLKFLKKNNYDLIILDVMLPDKNGFEVCKAIRGDKNYTPILMLTSLSEEIDKVIGLESGADDYLTKPFSIRELIARVKAILRRAEISTTNNSNSNKVLICEELFVDFQKRKVLLKDKKIELTVKEFDLLSIFICNPGKSYTRENLLNLVWGQEFSGYEHTVNSHINRLRTKIETDLTSPKYILTTWGIGYRFTDEIEINEKN